MNAAKETINYYCDDIIKDGYLGQGITAAVLDTGISLHPDFDSRIVAFRDFVDHREEVYDGRDLGRQWENVRWQVCRNGAKCETGDRKGIR